MANPETARPISFRAASREGVHLLQDPEWLNQPWLVHSFSTRTGGVSTAYGSCGDLNLGFTPTDDRNAVLRNRDLLLQALSGGDGKGASLVTVSQVHSADVHLVASTDPDTAKPVPTGDGLLTADPGVYLGILTADCVPVLVADIRRKAVGAFHAGWRGTVQRIVESGIGRMVETFGSHPGDLRALIGPAIGACCYTVGAEVRERFSAEFDYAADLMTPSPTSDCVQLDLREANRRQLLTAGLSAASIHLIGGCTSCEPEHYFSHRQSGGHTGRMMSVVGIRTV